MMVKYLITLAKVLLAGTLVVSTAVLPTMASQQTAAPAAVVEPAAVPLAESAPAPAALAASAPALLAASDPALAVLDVDMAPAVLPVATVGVAYSQAFTLDPAGTYTVTLTGVLPAGMTFDVPTLTLAGTPAVGSAGDYPLSFLVEMDGSDDTRIFLYTLTVVEPGAPVVTYTITGTLGNNGWYIALPVKLEWAIDGVKDLVACPDVEITADQVKTDYTCSATAGGLTTSVTVSIGVDTVAPTAVTGDLAPGFTPNANGWFNEPVDIVFTANPDATSGLDYCETETYGDDPGEGDKKGAEVTGKCYDLAGNEGTGIFLLDYDATAPEDLSIAFEREGVLLTGPDKDNDDPIVDWYNEPFDVVVKGTDATSGIMDALTDMVVIGSEATCQVTEDYNIDGKGLVLTGKCVDQADNEATIESDPFNYDNTAPIITVTVEPNPVYLNGPVTVTAVGVDPKPDIASGFDDSSLVCSDAITGSIGWQTVSCDGMDFAGNAAETAITGFSVIYKFEGFFRPIGEGWNEENAGRALPIKFALADYYDVPQDGAMVNIWIKAADCSSMEAGELLAGPQDVTADLQPQHHGRYHYNWKTDKETIEGTCAVVMIDLGEVTAVNETMTHDFYVQWK